jgi:glycosyltransferase involved in cell wall biosynthesis
MKIDLLVLSGDPGHARERLQQRYPGATIESIPRAELERKSPAKRLSALRSGGPDVFAVATESLDWQRGQNALLVFGALAGAQSTVLFDARGAWTEETSLRTLTFAPARFMREWAMSTVAILRAQRKLTELERAVARAPAANLRHANKALTLKDSLTIVYLRGTPGPGSDFGGAASHIKGVTDALTRFGAKLRIVSNDHLAGINPSNTPLVIVAPEPIGITRATFDLRNGLLFMDQATREIQRNPPHLIYERYSRFGCAGVAASLRTGSPLFLEYNGSEVWVGRHWDRVGMLSLLARYERLNLAAAARIFVVSEVDRRNLLSAGIKPEKIVVNPNGVDTERFRPNVGRKELREQLGLSQLETLVGFVGSFGPWHGVLAFAEAIKMIPRASGLRFLLVGSGSLRGEVERLLAAETEAGRVNFTGAVDHNRVPALLDACDILVSPHVPLADGSDFFGSPTKLFEYMAMGKGIVASRLGQIGEVLSDEETALLVEPGNVQQLSEAILRLADSPELRERLGLAARKAVALHYTWKHNAERVLTAYESWLKGT